MRSEHLYPQGANQGPGYNRLPPTIIVARDDLERIFNLGVGDHVEK